MLICNCWSYYSDVKVNPKVCQSFWVLVTGWSLKGIFGIFLRWYLCFCVCPSSIEPECIGLQPQDRLCKVFSIMLSHIENNDLSLSAARTLSGHTLAYIDCGGVQLPRRLTLLPAALSLSAGPVWIIAVPRRPLDKKGKKKHDKVGSRGTTDLFNKLKYDIWQVQSGRTISLATRGKKFWKLLVSLRLGALSCDRTCLLSALTALFVRGLSKRAIRECEHRAGQRLTQWIYPTVCLCSTDTA